MTEGACTILIVEDEAITALNLRNHLLRWGYSVGMVAATGQEAVDSALANPPVCILMDINLIGAMNGIEAAAEIHRSVDIPVIFMTGYANPEIREQAITVDPVAYLKKPVDMIVLERLLADLCFHRVQP